MSNKKISQLIATTDLVNADEFVVVDGGTTKKITILAQLYLGLIQVQEVMRQQFQAWN
jgi:hypothetical protein